MHDLTLHPPVRRGRPERICISNCDKDGSIVSARLASAIGAVSSTRPLRIDPDRYTDATYFDDIASSLAGYYRLATDDGLLDRDTVVLSSVHIAALYVAEALHAVLLPLQALSFASDLDEARTSPLLSVVGADHDVDLLWQWNKVSDISHFPEAYVGALTKATSVVVVRSTDTGDDCPILGRAGHVYVNASLPLLNARLWESLRAVLVDGESSFDHVRQWEWGLPDATVAAAKALWKRLGKPADRFHLIEAGTVELYERIPVLWQAYLQANSVAVRGVTINAYWTAHPYYERFAGLIPVHFYRFSAVEEVAARLLDAHGSADAEEGRLCAFVNDVGGWSDCRDVQRVIASKGLQDAFWFSRGFDCPDAECTDVYGGPVPRPFEKVAEWLTTAPYRSHTWRPLDVGSVVRLMNETDAPGTTEGEAANLA